LVRFTSVQVRLPPLMPVTVVLVPEVGPSAATNASNSSFADLVVKAAVAMVLAPVPSFVTVWSMASDAAVVTVSVAVWLTPL